MSTKATMQLAVAVATVGGLTGCSGYGTVEGRVIIDGVPQGGFEVVFVSLSDRSEAMGSSVASGDYRLYQGRAKTAIPIGEYKVTVVPTEFVPGIPKPKVKLPDTVTRADRTTLMKTVTSGKNVIDLEVSTVK